MSSQLSKPGDIQESLFEVVPTESFKAEFGYRGLVACSVVGITYRQLDYWARTELVTPSIQTAAGSGSQRLYSFTDILVLKIVKRLLDAGVSLQNIRTAVNHLNKRGVVDLASVTLMSDGSSIYECTSEQEVIDLVRGGQGVFGIAIGQLWREIEGDLALLPASSKTHFDSEDASDELSQRRARRYSA